MSIYKTFAQFERLILKEDIKYFFGKLVNKNTERKKRTNKTEFYSVFTLSFLCRVFI